MSCAIGVLVCSAMLLQPLSARAVDFSVSGFGTLGYALSDQPFRIQRFIDDRGTFKRDSVAGIQMDVRVASGVGATLQVKAAPATKSDARSEASVAWAFVSYRPTNDWLIRLGKQRIPFYLYSESYDVGATYDFARLPTEMYSIAPSNDFIGISVGKTWRVRNGDVSLDGYWGASSNDFRVWGRDGFGPGQARGAGFLNLDFKGGGLVLSYKAGDQTWRVGMHRALVKNRSGQPIPSVFPFVEVVPGVGYYQVDNALPGPGVVVVDNVTNWTVSLGLELRLPADVTLLTEFASSAVQRSDYVPHGSRGYVAASKRFDYWTPYLTYAFLRSPKGQRNFYTAVNNNTVPLEIPGASQINASQRIGADQIITYDQTSWALGTSYSFSATSKLKAEYMRTRVGDASALVDAPAGGNVRNQGIGVLSVSYSVVF